MHRWFLRIVASRILIRETDDPLNIRFIKALRAVRGALTDDWELQMSGENSPADKAGIDFIWSNRRLQVWWPVDTTFETKVGVPSLIKLAKLTLEMPERKLHLKCLTEFLELLARLTQESALLTYDLLAPPEMVAVPDPLGSLETFQAQLAAVGAKPYGMPFAEWASYLNGAIRYQKTAKSGRLTVEASLIDYAIGEAIAAFLDARKGACPDFDRGEYRRGGNISYSSKNDTLHVPDPVNPVWPDITTRIQQSFDRYYAVLMQLNRNEVPLLLIAKQVFVAQGIGWVIHHILDVVEAKCQGRDFHIAPKMKAPPAAVTPAVSNPPAAVHTRQHMRGRSILRDQGSLARVATR